MENEIKYAFIASPIVIRHKLGGTTADVLATLIYKYEHFKKSEKLFTYKNEIGFHVSISDIEEHTCLRSHTIKKCIAILKKEGLIISKQQGLCKPNFYSIDVEKINEYIEDHQSEYDSWRLEIRAKNKLVTPINSKMELKQLSGSNSDNFLEGTETTTTKNKNTKNKNTEKITNSINADCKIIDLHDDEDELIKLIDDVKYANDDDEKTDCIKVLSNFLLKMVPRFKNFNISEQDIGLIENVTNSSLKSEDIAWRILDNAKAIIGESKECRFGNLFVGLKEIAQNCDLKYG